MSKRSPEILWAISRSLHHQGMRTLARVVKTFNWALFKCLLPPEAIVGRNVTLAHHALGIVIHPQVTIGDNCHIYQHVSMAAESAIGSEHRIVIGNNVFVGASCVIVARKNTSLYVGDNSILGAGAIVTRDVPPWEVWAGNPARRIKGIEHA